MDNAMRRKDRQINESGAIEILRKGEFGVLSMCSTSNEGYGIPLNYVLAGNNIYFHCAIEGSKLIFLNNNNKASFCVVGNTKLLPSKFGTLYESAIAFGITSEVEGDEKMEALVSIIEKYSNEYNDDGKAYIKKYIESVKVIKLSIVSVTGKARKQ